MTGKNLLENVQDRSGAFYLIHDQKTAAGLDALLHSSQEYLEDLAEYLSLNRVILGNGGFCMLLGKVDFRPARGFDTLMDANGLFASILEQQLNQKAIYYMFPLQGMVLCLVAMPNLNQSSRRIMVTNELVWSAAQGAVEQFCDESDLSVLAAVSPTCFGLSEVPGTFQHTLDMLKFHCFFGNASGVCGSPEEAPKRNIRLSSEFQEDCLTALNLLMAGHHAEFLAHVEDTLSQIRTLVPASLQQYQTLCYQYLDRLCYDLIDHQLADPNALERTDLFWLVHEPRSFDVLWDSVRRLLDRLLQNQMIRRSGQNVDAIRSYIQLHHTDENLTVSAIAAQFGMSQPVFSAFFSKHTGVSPLEYLNKQRTATAMVLLQTTDETLSKICRQSGFGSVSTMHRIFKKFTGMTPGQARNA